MAFREEMAERLRSARKAAGLRQQDLAHALDMRAASISDYERGVNTPSAEVTVALARRLRVSVQWLMTGDETPPSTPPPPLPQLEAFLETPLGQTATDEERASLESLMVHGAPPTVATYQVILAALRGTR